MVQVQTKPEQQAFSAENIPLDIVFEDAHILVINKGESQGTIYIVNGSGGQLGGKQKDYPLKSSVYSNVTEGGSMLIDIVNKKLNAQWICADGVVRDMFSIEKK